MKGQDMFSITDRNTDWFAALVTGIGIGLPNAGGVTVQYIPYMSDVSKIARREYLKGYLTASAAEKANLLSPLLYMSGGFFVPAELNFPEVMANTPLMAKFFGAFLAAVVPKEQLRKGKDYFELEDGEWGYVICVEKQSTTLNTKSLAAVKPASVEAFNKSLLSSSSYDSNYIGCFATDLELGATTIAAESKKPGLITDALNIADRALTAPLVAVSSGLKRTHARYKDEQHATYGRRVLTTAVELVDKILTVCEIVLALSGLAVEGVGAAVTTPLASLIHLIRSTAISGKLMLEKLIQGIDALGSGIATTIMKLFGRAFSLLQDEDLAVQIMAANSDAKTAFVAAASKYSIGYKYYVAMTL